jgi:hypothetical protein
LVSKLPNIASINWSLPICKVLSRISTENVQAITYGRGPIVIPSILTEKCPNITTLTLILSYEDVSSLNALNNLVELHIEKGSYVLSNMETVLQGVGHRLQKLQLHKVNNVNMADILTLCSSLERLVLDCCTFLSINLHTVINRDLPHFKSVYYLHIFQVSQSNAYEHYLAYYVYLTVLVCIGVDILSDDFMTRAIHNGAFKNITVFKVEDTENGALSMITVDLLLKHFEHLETLGYLHSWHRLTMQNISDLKDRVAMQNLDLRILM